MAHAQHYSLPDGFEHILTPWIEARRRDLQWGNARSMRTLLEKVREAHALRCARDLDADVSSFDLSDIDAAVRDS